MSALEAFSEKMAAGLFADSKTLRDRDLTMMYAIIVGSLLLGGLCSIFFIRSIMAQEKELRDSEFMRELALDAAQVGLWTGDIQADKWDWDSRVNRMMGLPEGATPDLDAWVGALHPEDRDYVLEEFGAGIRGEKVYDVEYRVVWPDGKIRNIVARGKMTRDEKGEPARIDGITYDLTELRKAESAMRETEERFRSMVANVPGVIYQCLNDAQWTMKYLSDAVYDLTGYPAEEFIDAKVRSFAGIIHPDDQKRVDDEIQASLSSGEPFFLEYRIVRGDGAIRWVNERGRVVGGEERSKQHINGGIFDITERKQIEDELRKRVEELDEAHSTMVNMMADLDKEKRKAEEATKAKGDFLANMSHEIRTPMNAILGMTHLASTTDLDSRQRDYLNKIQSSANALLGIINDILDFSPKSRPASWTWRRSTSAWMMFWKTSPP